jgi:putative ABC transport system permease protein
VVGDMRSDSPASAPTPTLYLPVAQHPREAADMQLIVRTRIAPATMVDLLRTRLEHAHPDIAVQATTMRENIGNTERPERFRTSLLASFAGVSILLAAVGMYGVTSYTVAQRTFEFGLRVALGATRGDVLRLVFRHALTTAVLGMALGTGLSLGLSRVFASAVGTLPALDAVAYLLAALAVLSLSLAAALVSARAAARIDPLHALRTE